MLSWSQFPLGPSCLNEEKKFKLDGDGVEEGSSGEISDFGNLEKLRAEKKVLLFS